jgi:hypothetical protein
MKIVLLLCMMLGSLCANTEDSLTVIEKLKQQPMPLGYPQGELKSEMRRLPVFAQNPAAVFEKLSEQRMAHEFPRRESISEIISHSPEQSNFSSFALTKSLTEFLVDTSRYNVGVPGQQRYPVIGFDGTNFMAVWMDYERGLVGARIAADGIILDKPAFLISTQASPDMPDITFDGKNYFVVWLAGNPGDPIYGARIKPDGTVLDPNGFSISPTGDYNVNTDYGDGVYLIAWGTGTGRCALVDTNGSVLSEFYLGGGEEWSPDVSFNGTNFLTVWQEMEYQNGAIWGSRITPDGTNLDPGGFQIGEQLGAMMPVVDCDGTNWFVVWSWLLNDFSAAWVTPDGIPFGEINNLPGSSGMWIPEIVVGDSIHWLQGILAAGSNPPVDIYTSRIDFSGNVLDNPWIPVDISPGWQAYGGNTYGDSTFIAIWEDQVSWDIYARRYAPDGNPMDSTRFVVNAAVQSQYDPAIAFDGANYLAVYRDCRKWGNSVSEIYGSIISQDGTLLTPEGFLINQQCWGDGEPAVAFGDSLYLCVWFTVAGHCLWGTRILPDGTVLDPNGLQITFSGGCNIPISVSYNNAIFLIVYEESNNIKATRVTIDGQVLDPAGILIRSHSPGIPYGPEVAPYGSGFLVTWQWNSFDDYIEGTRVSFQGTVIDSPAIQISPPGVGYPWHGVASIRDTFLVVWDQGEQSICGARVDSSGTVLDPTSIPICNGQANSRTQPSVAGDGEDFLVVWQDSRLEPSQYDLYGARVSPTGVVLDTNGIELVNREYSRVNAELVSATANPDTSAQVLLVFEGFVDYPYNSNRALGAIYYPSTGIKEGHTQEISTGYEINISPSISCQKPYLLDYSLPTRTEIGVNVYDITGRLVRNVYDGFVKGHDTMGFTLNGIAQGVYFVRVETKDNTTTTRIIWLK